MKTRISFVLGILIFTACEKFDYTAEENSRQHIDSDTELQQAVTGAYAKFAEIFYDGSYRNSFLLQTINADDIYLGGNYESANCYTESVIQTFDENNDTVYLGTGCSRYYPEQNDVEEDYNEVMEKAYRRIYQAIVSQNNIINQQNNLPAQNELTGRLIGEVYFMRAYSYFRLTRLFGEIPVILDTDVSYNVTLSSFVEIYKQIESDLLQAIRLLPQTNSNIIPSTICPNRGCAKALLAEVYLTMGGYPVNDPSKYALAAQYAREVIDSASFCGFALLGDFADLYGWEFVKNSEMVSTIQFKSVTTYEDVEDPYAVSVYESNELSRHIHTFYAGVNFFNNFPLNYRKENTFELSHIISTWDATTFTCIEKTVYPLITTTCYAQQFKKSSVPYFEQYYEKKESYPLYILRFAHTLLTYAEASARSGNLSDICYEAINQVRRRANKLPVNTPSEYDLTTGLTTEQFLDSVVWERAWEFAGEAEGRWFDLLRLEMIDNTNELRDPNDYPLLNGSIQDGECFYPIPEIDIFLNPNLAE